MIFDVMAQSKNKPKSYIWSVAKNGLFPPKKCEIILEASRTIVIENNTIISKRTMQNEYAMFFADEESANAAYSNLKSVFNLEEQKNKYNFDAIKSANAHELSKILFNMIQELCEDGMPTSDEIESWLTLHFYE